MYIHRQIEGRFSHALERGKSILLLGARQTGKTTLIKHQIQADLSITFSDLTAQLVYQKDPSQIQHEVLALKKPANRNIPLVVIDEVQKIPKIMDAVQFLIDEKRAQFILTGSSARKLKQGRDLNLLPGRVVNLQLDALSLVEVPKPLPLIENLLIYGSLPEIIQQQNDLDKQTDLRSYIETYLREEIQAEAQVRNLGAFSRFLEYASMEAGRLVNFSNLSQEVGVARDTIYDYFQILLDCLIVNKIDPISSSDTRKRLSKAPKFIFFDLGIQRECANVGTRVSAKWLANSFEQFIGIEILRWIRINGKNFQLKYWRDHSGPEVDYVIDNAGFYLPLEVKYSVKPSLGDCDHLEKFIKEYSLTKGYIICRAPRKFALTPHVTAIPWQDLPALLDEHQE